MPIDRVEPQYFGAGPALLPTDVLKQASADLINFNDIGLGIGEISHRSKDATKVIEDSKQHLKQLMSIPDDYEVFFIQGGGTTGFSSIASNMAAAYLGKTGEMAPGGYLVSGSWSEKAYEEAQRLHIPSKVLFNSKDFNENGKYQDIPEESLWEDKIKNSKFSYVYLCENETVHGIEWPSLPKCITERDDIELVADLSSDILSREIDVTKYGVIMAGAQKNIGLAGLTVYIIKKSILKNIEKATDEQLQEFGIPITPIASYYPTVVKNNSAYNTIPIFTLHVMDLVFKHLIAKGGVPAQQKENEKKAQLLYAALDSHSDFYNLPVAKRVRSNMNAVFTLKDSSLDEKFLKEAEAIKLIGLKGHRSVGGFRASIYNALSVQTVENLAKFISKFAEENA
ncbi:hypothetical protein TPHA_0F02720 [Tetrapisispora phaffii CBS 4417]|uniref:Phosphoserine aminotransferase n=1 Tax=Tetrapisispora phaffii (strain ATCC 24235 / CBS 4417 / NBRC 1672 / NRRL Y-8282 / UCD 70-5) TaxID=1071381 RepID=G8BUG6_TETPH|nr:hypothetical protein TPHA_0F02720 [Tetrapisispora phaffii CBS 4417]CCE63752.1 hypothetical protein TPHA_0F02720 [Tetrapisispora phaffii CBS 4417]